MARKMWDDSSTTHAKTHRLAELHNFRPVCAAGTLYRAGHTCTLCPDERSSNALRHACYHDSKAATLPLAVRNRGGLSGDALLARADRVVLLSSRARELYLGFGLPKEKIALVPNFVDDIGFTPDAPAGSEWVYIGRLSEEKGVRSLIAHWPADEILNVYGDGPLRVEVELAASEGRGIRYHGPIPHERVPAVLADARGLIFPSEWAEGGIAQSYVEALAAGRIVVARLGSSVGDDLLSSGFGTVFEEWGDFTNALKSAGNQSQSALASARAHYESVFTPEAFAMTIIELYESLITSPRGGQPFVES